MGVDAGTGPRRIDRPDYAPSPMGLVDDFLMLEYEAHQNGNTNFCFFPESAEWFRAMAARLREAIGPHVNPEDSEDDDNAVCLLTQMADDSPHELPTTDDEKYRSLRRVLMRIGILPIGRDKNQDPSVCA